MNPKIIADNEKIPRFGKWLRAMREQRGFTLDDVAIRSGVRKGHLSKIENSETAGLGVSLAIAEKIAGAFGLQLWQALKENGSRSAKVDEYYVPPSRIISLGNFAVDASQPTAENKA